MRRADRLFEIVLLLGRGRVMTARDLGERLEVSERTVYRDIQDLCTTGVPIEGEAGVGYRLRRGYQVPPMMFSEEELQALLFGADVAKTWGDPELARAAERILAKVDAVLPERLRHSLESSRLVVPNNHYPESVAETLGVIRHAINDRRRVFLDYQTPDGNPSERIIWPLVLLYWGRTWTLGGWCELRNAFRTFRLDRIQDYRVLTSPFPDEEGRRLNDYLSQAGSRG